MLGEQKKLCEYTEEIAAIDKLLAQSRSSRVSLPEPSIFAEYPEDGEIETEDESFIDSMTYSRENLLSIRHSMFTSSQSDLSPLKIPIHLDEIFNTLIEYNRMLVVVSVALLMDVFFS